MIFEFLRGLTSLTVAALTLVVVSTLVATARFASPVAAAQETSGESSERELTEAEARAILEQQSKDLLRADGGLDRRRALGLVDGMIPTPQAIGMMQQKVADNPHNILALTMLGQLHLRQAKEMDHLPAYALAEESLRRAVEINGNYLPAKLHLAAALEARHQFAEALELASEVFVRKPSNTLALATVGDCQLQLGRYDEAEQTYAALADRTRSAPVLARLAHVQELNGKPHEAIRLVEDALHQARDAGQAEDSLAWYELRLADLFFGTGDVDSAATHFEAALQLVPHYAPAMTGMARVQVARGELDRATATLTDAVQRHGEPPTMAALGDVLARQGDAAAAEAWYEKADAAMQEEALTAAAAHYREVAMFYADRDRKPQRALELAEQDLTLRQDIYAHDALAWALYRNGRYEDALTSSQQALRLGTQDAALYFHLGMIHAAIGNRDKATAALAHALKINPCFSVLNSDVARAKLDALREGKTLSAASPGQ